ncbi:hypothetical protein SBA1_1040080 [Candidatus Sulfotelmatobacter kueseliae]|uniref:Uncharacterized protein n=1 Tax=Candidatus Sulfotelmatobacter kueseliae TaxID=2042962 RepID=A0A2U3JY07_9BACT|nr:hypothetical protein SBA1_1040080 [Candidatus Sulfotelmatobacter kueseliae]
MFLQTEALPLLRGVCPNALPFYKMKGLLPAVRRRKQGPSDSY